MNAFKLYSLIALLVLGLGINYQEAQAQVLKGLGKKIEDKVNRRIQQKVDRTIDKGLDKVEETAESSIKDANSSKKSNDGVSGILDQMMNKNNDVKLEDKYDFVTNVEYDYIEVKNNKEKNLASATMWYSKSDYLGMTNSAAKNMFILMDRGNFVTFMEDQKTYLVMSADMFANIIDEEIEDNTTPPISKKIGTENLLGYNCTIYQITTDENDIKIWLAEDLKYGNGNFMGAFANVLKKKNMNLPNSKDLEGGTVLKMETTIKSEKSTIIMEAKKINQHNKTLSTKEYKTLGS